MKQLWLILVVLIMGVALYGQFSSRPSYQQLKEDLATSCSSSCLPSDGDARLETSPQLAREIAEGQFIETT